jgi:hypothetical protein
VHLEYEGATEADKDLYFIVSAYAPVANTSDHVPTDLYQHMFDVYLEAVLPGEMFVCGTDTNCSMGVAQGIQSDPVVGRYGKKCTNWQGMQLKTKLTTLGLVAASTFFRHMGASKGGTFFSKTPSKNPDGSMSAAGWKQLDHFIVKKEDMGRVLSACTQMRNRQYFDDSDHVISPCKSDHQYVKIRIVMKSSDSYEAKKRRQRAARPRSIPDLTWLADTTKERNRERRRNMEEVQKVFFGVKNAWYQKLLDEGAMTKYECFERANKEAEKVLPRLELNEQGWYAMSKQAIEHANVIFDAASTKMVDIGRDISEVCVGTTMATTVASTQK